MADMNWRAIRAIMRKDLQVALQSNAVAMPMLIVPLILVVFLPTIVALVPFGVHMLGGPLSSYDTRELAALLARLPPALRQELAGYDLPQAIVIFLLTYLFAPLYLIVPIMVSSVIAADSFAGEKERKTLEALVYTPTTDQELLLAKVLAGWLPGIAIGLGSFVVYSLVANVTAWPTVGRIFFPNRMWLVLALWVAPAAAGLGLGVTVLISARVNTFQEAYQLGGLVVLPIIILVLGQISGVLYLHVTFVVIFGALLWLIDLVLFWVGQRLFERSQLLTRL
jgi:ABC-2 type transport system permease protein